MALRTKETIFNAALTRLGQEEVSPGDGTGLWKALENNYDDLVRAAFETGAGTYPFGKKRETLTSRTTGNFGFDDAYTLPDDAIHVVEVFFNEVSASNALEDWEIDGQNHQVHLNAKSRTVEVEFVAQGQEHTWSAQFAQGIQRRCEAVIKEVLEEHEEAMSKDEAAEFELLKAGVKGAKSRAKQKAWKPGGGRLIRARRGYR